MFPPTLIDLPRELRDLIYEHLIDTPGPFDDPLSLTALPSGTRRYTNGVHALLRVNKCLRNEALDHMKDCDTYLVSQRYRAFAGFDQMTAWKPAPIPRNVRRMYLRIYIAVPECVARPVVRMIDSIWQESLSARMHGDSWRASCPQVFSTLTSMLETCAQLEDLVLELAIRRQDTPFGQGCESAEFLDMSGGVLDGTFKYEMEQAARRLPELRRYAFFGEGYETRLIRRNAGEQWIPACLIPQCVNTCHCYGSFATTCVEATADLLGDLTPRSCGQWRSV